MDDPLEQFDAQTNKLPIDPAWSEAVDALCARGAAELKSLTLVIAVQEGGKLAFSMSGVPDSGELKEMSEDVPGMLVTLARVIFVRQEIERHVKRTSH